jgi:hypothetical protein
MLVRGGGGEHEDAIGTGHVEQVSIHGVRNGELAAADQCDGAGADGHGRRR